MPADGLATRAGELVGRALRARPRVPASWRRTVGWTLELVQVPGGLLAAHLPGVGLDARARERLVVVVADERRVAPLAAAHGRWLTFLGAAEHGEPGEHDDADLALVDYARACAAAGHPVDATVLAATRPSEAGAARATVARAALLCEGLRALAIVIAADTTRADTVDTDTAESEPDDGPGLGARVRAVPLAVVLAPPALVDLAVASALGGVARLAPHLPEPRVVDGEQANLVAHLLAEAVPGWLGHALVRTAVVLSPVTVALAVAADGAAATARVGRNRIVVENGVADDAGFVLDGPVEPLLAAVAGSILRDLSGTRSAR